MPERAARRELPARRVAAIVIGAGYTGLAAARRLAELRPDDEVLLVESSTIGEGAAGRNAGMIIGVPHALPIASPAPDGGRPPHLDIHAANLAWLRALVRDLGIRCDWHSADMYAVAATAAGASALETAMARYRGWGVSHRTLDSRDIEEMIGTRYYRSGFVSGQNVLLQPAALVRGLADTLPPGIRLMENTTVEAISGCGPYEVVTTAGTFETGTVVLATNGSAKALGFLRDRLVTIVTYAALTPVLPEATLSRLGTASEWGILPAHRLGTTFRRTADGRMLVRGGYSYERERPMAEVEACLRSRYRARYPALETHEFEHVWGGATALTRNGAAFVGELRPGLFAAAGCNGSGILKGSLNGKLLAEMAVGHRSAAAGEGARAVGPSWFPPEPVRRLGVQAAIRYQRFRAGAEC